MVDQHLDLIIPVSTRDNLLEYITQAIALILQGIIQLNMQDSSKDNLQLTILLHNLLEYIQVNIRDGIMAHILLTTPLLLNTLDYMLERLQGFHSVKTFLEQVEVKCQYLKPMEVIQMLTLPAFFFEDLFLLTL